MTQSINFFSCLVNSMFIYLIQVFFREKCVNPTFILARPQLGENIGASARILWNFGISGLRLVSPRDGWPNRKASTVSSGGGQVLDNAEIFSSVDMAISDLNFVFATTIRSRKYDKDIFSPEEAVIFAKKLIKDGNSVGILFGSERAGLETHEIGLANCSISIPVNSAFKSLNLSHAVGILAYEWFKCSDEFQAQVKKEMTSNSLNQYASGEEVQNLTDLLLKKLETSEYFWPQDRRESLTSNIVNLLNRLPLSSSDIRTLFGIIKSLTKDSQ